MAKLGLAFHRSDIAVIGCVILPTNAGDGSSKGLLWRDEGVSDIGLVNAARQIAKDVLRPHAEDVDQQERYPEEGLAALIDSGICGLTVAREFGRFGADAGTSNVVFEALAGVVHRRSRSC